MPEDPAPLEPHPEGAGGPVAVDLRDYVVFDLAGAAGRRVVATDVLAVDLVCLEPGQAVGARLYETADVLYTVLGGRAWVVTDEAEVGLTALQAVLIPEGTAHGLRNDAADPLILQVVLSPPEDPPEVTLGGTERDVLSGATPTSAFGRGRLVERLRRTLGG